MNKYLGHLRFDAYILMYSKPWGADRIGSVDGLAQTGNNVVQAYPASNVLPSECVSSAEVFGDDAPQLVEGGREIGNYLRQGYSTTYGIENRAY